MGDMNKACKLCKGACCRSCIVYLGDGGKDLVTRDVVRFTKLHGTETPAGTRFEAPCRELVEGLCMIYENRPTVCRNHWVGCPNCLQSIDHYHSPEMAELIKKEMKDVTT